MFLKIFNSFIKMYSRNMLVKISYLWKIIVLFITLYYKKREKMVPMYKDYEYTKYKEEKNSSDVKNEEASKEVYIFKYTISKLF